MHARVLSVSLAFTIKKMLMNIFKASVLPTLLAVSAAGGTISAQTTPPSISLCVDGFNPSGQACVKTIQTGVPFLGITPDARSGAMGDVGIALSPTAASTYWNPSALPFSEETFQIQATFTPWLRALNLDDVYLANLAGYGQLDDDQAVYGDLRYFSLGSIDFTNSNGQPIRTSKPYEMALSAGYARKLSDNWSGNITGRFILSSLATGLTVDGTGDDIQAGKSIAADIGVTHQREVAVADGSILRFGAVIRNIGSKITYTNSVQKDFLPTNLGLGSSLQMYLDDYNSLTFALDFNKLLVPSPQLNRDPGTPDPSLTKSPIEGIFSSFGDAEEGFSEELNEINVSIGAEYWYAEQFAARLGFFNEPNTKGGRRYLTVGVGLVYNVLNIDFSYLVPTTNQTGPLDNTLRLSLGYAFGGDTY